MALPVFHPASRRIQRREVHGHYVAIVDGCGAARHPVHFELCKKLVRSTAPCMFAFRCSESTATRVLHSSGLHGPLHRPSRECYSNFHGYFAASLECFQRRDARGCFVISPKDCLQFPSTSNYTLLQAWRLGEFRRQAETEVNRCSKAT